MSASHPGDFQYTKLEHALVFVLLCGMAVFLTRTVRSFQQRSVSIPGEDDATGDASGGEGDADDDETDPADTLHSD